MVPDLSTTVQALLATLFTWGLTAAGSATVILLRSHKKKSLDIALGFAAGVMIAASFWSLLGPAIEQAESSKIYGEEGQFACLPIALGFILGGAFVFATDKGISYFGIKSPATAIIALSKDKTNNSITEVVENPSRWNNHHLNSIEGEEEIEQERRESVAGSTRNLSSEVENSKAAAAAHWKRIILLVVAITLHNIPEGLAVGVSFGAIGSTPALTFEAARNLAIGIGIQNFPEGLAVSVPLHSAGFSLGRAFFYGQLSGIVEPIFGVIGALIVSTATIVLPYALSFAAGAMIYVVADDILPEAHQNGNGQLATLGLMTGFTVMMCLDVALG